MQDIVGRYGGEEFVVLLPQTGIDAGLAIAERIRSRIAESVVKEVPHYTVSIGIADLNMEHSDMVALLDAADKAMYCAKRAGRNGVMAAVMQDFVSAGMPTSARPA